MRYLGGKARHAHLIAPYINALVRAFDLQTYCEPFCGMFSVGRRVVAPVRLAGDLNPDIVAFHNAVRDGWVPPSDVTAEEFRAIKLSPNPSALRGFVLSQCTFGADPAGGYARDAQGNNYALRGVRAAEKLRPEIQGVAFTNRPYWETPHVDLIYCDPPYAGTSGYNEKRFGKFDSEAFWAWVRQRSRASFVLVSEYTGPPDFHVVWEKPTKCQLYRKSGSASVERIFSLTPAKHFRSIL